MQEQNYYSALIAFPEHKFNEFSSKLKLKNLDLEIDLGYRDVAVGDSFALLGFSNVPGTRRMGTFQLRLGVMY